MPLSSLPRSLSSEGRVAVHDCHVQAHRFQRAGIIGQPRIPEGGMGFGHRLIAEGLGCLRPNKILPRDCFFDQPAAGALDRIRDRQGRDRSSMGLQRGQHPVDDRMGDKGTGCVMDQDDLRREIANAVEAIANGLVPFGTAEMISPVGKPLRASATAAACSGSATTLIASMPG